MTINNIIYYVVHTPHNTNKAILNGMLIDLIRSYGGRVDENGEPGQQPEKVIYDGGIEKY